MTEGPGLYKYILLTFLLILSFYFSGSESAIFSLNRLERNSLKETNTAKKKKKLVFLLDNQDQLLISILTGNMIVNIFASSLGSEIGDFIFAGGSELLSIIGMTILLLLVGELTPKRIAVNHSKGFTRLTASPLYYVHLFFTPVRSVLNLISDWILNIFQHNIKDVKKEKHALVLSAAELGYNEEILGHSEYRMFKSYLAFKDKHAGDVMTPRVLLKSIACDLSIKEVIDLVESFPEYVVNSSIILYKNDNDNFYGWVAVTDLLECKFNGKRLNEKIRTLSKNFYTVPQSKNLQALITELREAETDIALIIDEYGSNAGVVWFRDIIQDILKVFYSPEKIKLDKETAGIKEIPGSLTLEEFQEILGIEIEDKSVTVAGFFLERFDEIPKTGDEIIFHEIRLSILEMEGNKISKLQLEIRPER